MVEDQTTGGDQSASKDDDFEDISWEDAAADLEKQREMLRDAAAGGAKEDPAPTVPAVAASASDSEESLLPVPENINRILDIPLKITVELGRTKMLINDLLQLGQGSVIELSKLVGEPLEILVNNKLIGKGEVVVINEKFGVRLTDITSTVERIESFK